MPSSTDDRSRAGSATPPYETRDVNTGAVVAFLIFLSIILGLVLLATRVLFHHYSTSEQQPAPASSFFAVRQVPAPPDLQVNPRADLVNAYTKQEHALETYAWEDRKSGIVHIPIERAMDLLLKKGLPVISGGTETARGGGPTSRRPGETAPAPNPTGENVR